jgi:hypothetical protein
MFENFSCSTQARARNKVEKAFSLRNFQKSNICALIAEASCFRPPFAAHTLSDANLRDNLLRCLFLASALHPENVAHNKNIIQRHIFPSSVPPSDKKCLKEINVFFEKKRTEMSEAGLSLLFLM